MVILNSDGNVVRRKYLVFCVVLKWSLKLFVYIIIKLNHMRSFYVITAFNCLRCVVYSKIKKLRPLYSCT